MSTTAKIKNNLEALAAKGHAVKIDELTSYVSVSHKNGEFFLIDINQKGHKLLHIEIMNPKASRAGMEYELKKALLN